MGGWINGWVGRWMNGWMGDQLREGRGGEVSTFMTKDPLGLHCIPGGDGEIHTNLE